jgi:diguanylate cyclase (GGDEF)-like protein
MLPPATPVVPRRRLSRLALAFAVLALGILGSLLAAWQVKNNIDQEALAAFSKICDEVTIQVNDRLTAYALLLQGGQALFAASESVERDEWYNYVNTVRAEAIVPGHQGLGFSLLIQPDELAAHEATVQAEGFPDYRVRPTEPRDIYSSIVYLEPFAGRNLRAFGYDMFSEPVRRLAMEKSRDTGLASLTGKVILMQEDDHHVQPGTLMYVPVYRNNAPADTVEEKRAALLGWVYSPYRMHDLMTGIVPDWKMLGDDLVDLHVYDGDHPDPARLLFDSDPSGAVHDRRSILHAERTIDFNGHHWLLVFNGSSTADRIGYTPVWITAAGGLAISGLLFGLLLSIFRRTDALRLAESYASQIREMAFHDSLTGLPNRRLLDDRLAMALAAGHRQQAHGALLLLDLDNFKPLNDKHGHAAGDELLKEVARRLHHCVRETDTVARLGGDEFVVLLPALNPSETTSRHNALEIAEKIRIALEAPYPVHHGGTGHPLEHRCTCSIGLTLFTGHETDPATIIKRADTAMYQAKKNGPNRISAPNPQ